MIVEHLGRLTLTVGGDTLAALVAEAKARRSTVVAVAAAWLAERAALTPFVVEMPCDGCGVSCTYIGRGDRELHVRAWQQGVFVPRCEGCEESVRSQRSA